MSLTDDDARYRTAILEEEDDDQYLLTGVRGEYAMLTDLILRKPSLGRHQRDWALDWLASAQQCYGHFLLRGAVVHALASSEQGDHSDRSKQTTQTKQAAQETVRPDAQQALVGVQEAIAQSWQECWAGALAFGVERLSRELAASARLTARERRALLGLMHDLNCAIDAAVLAAETAWAAHPAAASRSAPWVRAGLDVIDSPANPPPGVPTDLLLPAQDPSLPPDPYQGRPQPRWGDAPLAAVIMLPATTTHLTETGWTTLCGRDISPPYQAATTFGRRGCKRCRRQAARQALLCVACRRPRLTEGHPGYCEPCSRKRRSIPFGALSLEGQLDRLLQEDRSEW